MKCSFCETELHPGTGKIYVLKDGTRYYFCTSKCENNFMMGRKPRKLKWASKPKK
jgi:large subunit ribosomal protein L24e